MKEKKGQALIEFILIFPIFMFLILGMIDFGSIFYKRYILENDLDLVVEYYREEKLDRILDYAKKGQFEVVYQKVDDQLEITLKKELRVITPGLNKILGNPYELEVKRVIYEST